MAGPWAEETVVKEFAKGLYLSPAWKKCRDAYASSRRGLCEMCLEKGVVRPGVIVHHVRHVSPENVGDPSVTLDWRNLRLVCRDCHAELHSARTDRRWEVDELGRVTAREAPLSR